uniref:glucuronosyltransferase n=1 Tax=Heligmosomoides polygyrus TaxID=6339 RepID=A0A183GNU4_HELPZ
LEVFESMPDTTFIWKYEEKGATLTAHLKNVYLSTWVPQNALLGDSRLTVFVTHGGLGSVTELAHMGRAAILIPIFGDQTRNALMFSKHGGGIVLIKDDLKHPMKLKDALHSMFKDASYSLNAKRLSDMLLNQPISPNSFWCNTQNSQPGQFGRLPNLDPYGRHLSYIEYFLIDIVLVFASVLAIICFVVVRIFRKCFSRSTKSKKD